MFNSAYKARVATAMPVAALAVMLSLCMPALKAHAFAPNYNPSNLIDNPTFTDNTTMTPGAIQAFLSNVGGGIASYSDVEACDPTIAPYYGHCGQRVSAAQIIYDSAQAYGINPRAILATLEKEQSLVTDPTPSASQINCAMGYNSCSNYVGFFTQVDNGTWILRYNYEGAFQHATWLSWHPGGNYPCANASSLYSAGLYPGNSVTFANPGGTAVTVTLANAASASLYCYTPYVGPYNQTGYSGSYNFVYYFQLWFGSTQATTAYAWQYDGLSAYADSAHTQPFTDATTVAPGSNAYIQLAARNVGYQYWTPSVVHLGTSNPNDRSSQFYDTSWLNPSRAASLTQSSVTPGSDGTFNFVLHAPQQTGTYLEHFNLVADGIAWFNDPGFYVAIDVVSPTQATNNTNTGLTANQTLGVNQYLLSPDTQSTLSLQANGGLVLNGDYRPVWSNGVNNPAASFVVMQPDGNLVEYSSGGQPLWASGTSGSGNHLVLQTDGNLVIYSSGGSPLWSTATGSIPNHLSKVNEALPGSSVMYIGQSLQTAKRDYSLAMQADGNLVEYNSIGRPLWASGTSGSGNFAAMQGDGNLVIYSSSGRPLWASRTNGGGGNYIALQSDGTLTMMSPSGSGLLWSNRSLSPGQSLQAAGGGYFLTMQADGNLVEYNSIGRPLWASGTSGSGNFAAMQGDGNLVIYSWSGKPLWATHTNGQSASVVMQGDGNIVLYSASGAVWASGS